MHLHPTANILIFFVLNLIFSTRAINLENDITKPLDKWFDSIFSIHIDQTYNLDCQSYLKNFEHNSSHGENHTKFRVFERLNIGNLHGPPDQLDFKFSTNELRLSYDEMSVNIWGKFGRKNHSESTVFDACITFENVTITAVASNSDQLNGTKISSNLSYERFTSYFYVRAWFLSSKPATKTEQEELHRELPVIFRDHLCHSSDFAQSLNVIYQQLTQPRNELLSKLPHFLQNPGQFYYLIPRVPFFCFLLKRIIIANLSNLDSFKIEPTSKLFTHTLLVKDLEGSMSLDYQRENEAPLNMNFKIGHLYVVTREATNCVLVQAHFWKITRAESNVSLSYRQSQVLIRELESTIAASILPLMKVGKVCNIETPLEKMKIANTSDWKSVKESYQGWIPFNDDVYSELDA